MKADKVIWLQSWDYFPQCGGRGRCWILKCWDLIRKLHWLESRRREAVLTWPGWLAASSGPAHIVVVQYSSSSTHCTVSLSHLSLSTYNESQIKIKRRKTKLLLSSSGKTSEVAGRKVMIILSLLLFCYSFVWAGYCIVIVVLLPPRHHYLIFLYFICSSILKTKYYWEYLMSV